MENKKRLIDANALSNKVDESKHDNPHTQGRIRVNHRNEHDHFLRMILDEPTVDAVEVVRCKECRHSEPRETYLRCVRFGFMSGHEVNPNGFCSYGERERR